MYEIERRGIYTNNLKDVISKLLKNCVVCLENKLNNSIKPANIQIVSKKPLERFQINITYFKNKLNIKELENKYLLNLTDHFSIFSQGCILNNKTSEEVISKLKLYIEEIGKPEIIHSDNGGEFTSNLYKNFCAENSIKIIYGSPYYPQSQGSVEAFNKTIMNKLEYIRLEEGTKFNIDEAIKKTFKIYNNTIHSIIKIEPEKAFKFKKKNK